MRREDRVKVAVGMTKVVTAICIASIKENEGPVTEEELIVRARSRMMYGRRRLGEL